jgi:IS1 family transposase
LIAINQLSIERRAQVVRCLVEGNSLRSTARLTGASVNTVMKLLVDVGEVCAVYQDHKIRNISAKRIQCDEVWSFIGQKHRSVPKGERATGRRGDSWTWTAMDADSKLIVSWLVGTRRKGAAQAFLGDLYERLATRVQLTTDGHNAYVQGVDAIFGSDVDYGMLVKLYAAGTPSAGRYSPPVCVGAEKMPQWGNPDPDHISTSYVERANLTMRMSMRRFTRLTNAFSKKLENHIAAVDLHMMYYNFCRPHTTLTQAHPLHYPTTPAMAAGIAYKVWTAEDVCGLIDQDRLIGASL